MGTQYLAWSHVKTFISSFYTVSLWHIPETCFKRGSLGNGLCFLLISLRYKNSWCWCVCVNLCATIIIIITIKHFHNSISSEITTMNAIGADSAASLSLVSKATNRLPKFGSQCWTVFFSNSKQGGNCVTSCYKKQRSRLAVFSCAGNDASFYPYVDCIRHFGNIVRNQVCVSGDLIMNIPGNPRAVKSASTNISWYQILFVYYI